MYNKKFDLNSDMIYQQIKNEIGSMSYMEMELPEAFKSNVTTIGDRSISYHKYTAIAYKTRADSIIIPNFWFYLAVKILPYNIELHRYYDNKYESLFKSTFK